MSSNQQYPSSSSEPHLPPCKPKSNSKAPQSKSKPQVKSKGKSKSRRKNAVPTKTPGRALPTMPPFDFEGYLRQKDNRNFKLLIDQPEKCHIGGAGGRIDKDSTSAPYMLIAVKSIAADFDKRQVKCAVVSLLYSFTKKRCLFIYIYSIIYYHFYLNTGWMSMYCMYMHVHIRISAS